MGWKNKVKAAFVYNFARFTQWPDSTFANATDPYLFCFVGNDDVAKKFTTINEKKNGPQKISTQRVYSPDEYRDCEIVFISRETDPMVVKQIIAGLEQKPVLTIGETPEFTKLGGIISFFSKNNRLHFKINNNTAKKKSLALSSRLLKLAVVVDDYK